MKFIVVGFLRDGNRRVYIDISKEEAIKRYEKENSCNVTNDNITVREMLVNDTFNAYDIWTDNEF